MLEGSRIISEQWGNHHIIYVYDETGAPVGMYYRTSSYAEGTFDVFYFEKNLQGDIIGVYNSSGTLLALYDYDAWGNCTAQYASGATSTGAVYNPFRYRGYYYDTDLGLYYLNSRYYDANTGRFINADNLEVIGATPLALTDKNLYAYCDNNPIVRTDNQGQFWETLFDVVSFGYSVVDVITNPSNPWAWAGLVGDTVDFIPFVTGVGEITKATGATMKIVDAIDDVHDAAKAIDNGVDAIDSIGDVGKATSKIHANSLSTSKMAEGYILRDIDTHEILKYGETTLGNKRYSKKYLIDHNAYMDFVTKGSKPEMHRWQHDMIVNYTIISGNRPPLNRSLW